MKYLRSTRSLMLVVAAVALGFGLLATHNRKLGISTAVVPITIRVVDDSFNPVAGAKITLIESDVSHPDYTGYSDDKGEIKVVLKTRAIGYEGPFFTQYKIIHYMHTIIIEHSNYLYKEDDLVKFMTNKTYYDNRYKHMPIVIILDKK